MQRRRLIALSLSTALVIGASACGGGDDASDASTASSAGTVATSAAATAVDTDTGATTAPTDAAVTSTTGSTSVDADADVAAFTATAATAAQAFLTTLTSDQQDTVLFDLDDSALESGWSNLPIDMAPRNGLALGDMTDEQQTAALALVRSVLSDQGYSQFEDTRTADTYLGTNGSGQLTWGAQHYYVAIFGTPSATDTWRLQVGGHHYALMLTFEGGVVTTTPEFTGIEPTSFTADGRTVEAMSQESSTIFGMFSTLDDAQLASARLSGAFDDVLLGPGNDGEFPATEGIRVSDLSADQQQAVVDAVMAWAGDVGDPVAAVSRATVEAELADTYISWATSTDATQQGAYARIDGPSVWIEMIAQGGIGFAGVHYHSIYRNKTSDYGAGS